jgi:hypothetical protein
MTYAQRMIETNPSQTPAASAALAECIEACFDCAQACTACADAYLGEEDVQMLVRCIRLDLDRADVCESTARRLSTRSLLRPPFGPVPKRATCAAKSASSMPSTMSTTESRA